MDHVSQGCRESKKPRITAIITKRYISQTVAYPITAKRTTVLTCQRLRVHLTNAVFCLIAAASPTPVAVSITSHKLSTGIHTQLISKQTNRQNLKESANQ